MIDIPPVRWSVTVTDAQAWNTSSGEMGQGWLPYTAEPNLCVIRWGAWPRMHNQGFDSAQVSYSRAHGWLSHSCPRHWGHVFACVVVYVDLNFPVTCRIFIYSCFFFKYIYLWAAWFPSIFTEMMWLDEFGSVFLGILLYFTFQGNEIKSYFSVLLHCLNLNVLECVMLKNWKNW